MATHQLGQCGRRAGERNVLQVQPSLAERGLKLDRAISLEVPFADLLGRIKDRVECPECRWSGQAGQLVSPSGCPVCGSPAGPRADDSEGFIVWKDKRCARFSAGFIVQRLMRQAKVERKSVQFMMARMPVEIGGGAYYKILLSNPILR